ncbi:MAG: polysaccharide biosynthesis tyrosine autokinase, partial [Bacteroidales bacterium]|nr:polysaccharide biosynthesis tyrosine autokinase [Bacteroidales bacterium]
MATENTENRELLVEEEAESSFNLRDILFKILLYWPWFLASVIACVILAYVYLCYKAPVYNVTASVLIKEDQKRARAGQSAAIESMMGMGGFSMTNNFDNELEILKSRTLIRNVIVDLGLYMSTGIKRTFGYALPAYNTAPVKVYMDPLQADSLPSALKMEIDYHTNNKVDVSLSYTRDKQKFEMEKSFNSLPAVVTTNVGAVTITANPEAEDKSDAVVVATIVPPTDAAASYGEALSVAASSKTTTIAKLEIKDTNTKRAIDFLNKLLAFYNQDANNEKNEVATKTAQFIDDRITIINQDLGSTEDNLANFKQQSGLTNLTNDAQLALTESSKYEQQRIENATQITLVEFLQSYINNPANEDDVIPANVGLSDSNLSAVITEYNKELIENKRLARTTNEANPVMQASNEKVSLLRNSVKTTVASVLRGLRLTDRELSAQTGKFKGRISQAPQQEKEIMTISRKQEIMANLYVMLLEKREENAITLAATANNGRFIETPLADKFPVSPKKSMIYLIALVLGMGIPFGIIYLIEMLKYKIENTGDVKKLTDVPVLAEIGLNRNKKGAKGAIVVRENRNDLMEETFRGLRTNILFMLEKGQNVIMFSSTQPSEGKSFIAGNTAASLAFLGKKVIVVGMDIRKPGLNKVFNISRHGEGITNYLSNPESTKLEDYIQHSDVSPNLDILPGGTVPPNPTELVARPILDETIEYLRKKYDIVILDTAPIAMVTDTAIIARTADMCVYVCRADVTPKAGFEYVNVLKEEKKFAKLGVVINGIDMTKRKNSYGYGYGKRYGYGKKYGYGYGYGY